MFGAGLGFSRSEGKKSRLRTRGCPKSDSEIGIESSIEKGGDMGGGGGGGILVNSIEFTHWGGKEEA